MISQCKYSKFSPSCQYLYAFIMPIYDLLIIVSQITYVSFCIKGIDENVIIG